nr:methyltransferase domain-containing protein [Streptomyces sp. SID13031]
MRAVLGAFAELVDGKAAEIGCGPGNITSHLASLGLDIRGIDLAPRMVEIARAHACGQRRAQPAGCGLRRGTGDVRVLHPACGANC